MLPCCGRVRGLEGTDVGDAFFKPSTPSRGEPAALRRARDLERDFGPNEGGGGAFLKLRGKLAESRLAGIGNDSTSLSPALVQRPPGAPGAGTSPAARNKMGIEGAPAGTSATEGNHQGGLFASIGSSISALGSNLGVPIAAPAQMTPRTKTSSPTGILKSGEASGQAWDKTSGSGGDTYRSYVSTRPLSHRDSARRCGSLYSSLHSSVYLSTTARSRSLALFWRVSAACNS